MDENYNKSIKSTLNKWVTEITYVDIETGEIIPRYELINYTVINTEKNYKINENYNIRELINYCEPTRNNHGKQTELF